MSKIPPSEEDASAATSASPTPMKTSPFEGLNISKLMSSTGPVVKCVLLRAAAIFNEHDDQASSKPKADDEVDKDAATSLHPHLITEIEVDTTPRKSQVNTILGGPFTFLGQYEDEGIVVMIRRPTPDDGNDEEEDDDANHGPINPHRLQPPFHNVMVRGDILLMRVAPVADDETDAALNNDGDVASTATTSTVKPSLTTMNNDSEEFFLNYTKEEYLTFASRTDIIAMVEEEEEENASSDGGDENDDEDDEKGGGEQDSDDEEDFDPDDSDVDDSDGDDEESQVAMMNMILNMMIKQFREKNQGRGPDSVELLAMRKALADKMGIENVTGPDDVTPLKEGNPEQRRSAKKVVVAEEMNETTPIPCRRSSSTSSNDEKDEGVDEIFNGDVGNLKRPAQDKQEQHGSSNKKAKTS